MKSKLWNELNDQQAEKVAGGAGIGEDVKGVIQEFRPLTPNQSAQEFGYRNFGEAVSEFAQDINGPDAPV